MAIKLKSLNHSFRGSSIGEASTFNEFFFEILNILCSDWDPLPYSEDILTNILSMCHKWEVKPGMEFAINGLQAMDLSPARSLELALFYSIPQWIEPAIAKMMDIPVATYQLEQIASFGQAFIFLAKAREMVGLQRLHMGYTAPPVFLGFGHSCDTHAMCLKAWDEFWLKVVARDILHPVTPLRFDKICEYLTNLDIPGMNPVCKEDTIVSLVISDKMTSSYNLIVDGAVAGIKKAYNLS